MDAALPEGTITFLFTDIQGSTRLLQRLGEAYGEVLSTHAKLLREAAARCHGHEVDTQGDAFFFAFDDAGDGLAAAVLGQRLLLSHPWPHGEPVLVRMGLHTGTAAIVDGGYVGLDVHRAARIASAAHGGQVVLSDPTHRAVVGRVADVTFRDLGEHLLKDLEDPERIRQVVADGLPTDFAPLKSLRPPTNIPRPAGDLVGRRAERADLAALLTDPSTRLVTVTGPGGAGKTRLAVATALEVLGTFPAGGFFVDLASIDDGDRAMVRVADDLGVPLEPGGSVVDALVEHIGERRLLLVLDNFEHVLPAAAAVARLLRSCGHLTLLVTSRIVLSLRDETVYPLVPLAGPDAVQLFVARARSARPAFELTEANAATVAEICALVDGLPLAIELAAARLKLFSPEALRNRLDDRLRVLAGGAGDAPERHQAMRTTIDWSYRLLSPEEQSSFRQLAVFSAGATFDAVERVTLASGDTEDRLAALVDHSLVRSGEDDRGELRFDMLQVIREYAAQLLEEDPVAPAVRERHARHYAAMAEEAAREEGDVGALAADQANLRSALDWLLVGAEEGSAELARVALRTATALGRFWYRRGDAVEGGAWLERALAVAGDVPEVERAAALRQLGVLLEQRRDLDDARLRFEEALGCYRRAGDRPGEAACLNSLGVVARTAGDLAVARELLLRSLELRRSSGDGTGIAPTTSNLAMVLIDDGDLDGAVELLDEALRMDRASGDAWATACSANNLGVAHLLRGDVTFAAPLLHEALATFTDYGDDDGVAESLEALVGTAVAEGRWVRAARLAGSAEALRSRIGIAAAPVDRRRVERWLERARTELGEDAYAVARAEGASMTTEQATRHGREATVTALP